MLNIFLILSINENIHNIYRNMSEPYYIIIIFDVYGEYDYMGIERC